MKILNSIDEFIPDNEQIVLTIGSFDGVHKGHVHVFKQLKDIAEVNNSKTLVITFSPHPRIFFNPKTDLRLLTNDNEKAQLIEMQKIDYLVFQKFDENFSNLSPKDFIKKLKKNFQMKGLLVGYDHHFGKNREGSFKQIQILEEKYGFKTYKTEAIKIGNNEISSTLIRHMLRNGNIEEANLYLGYNYFITGKVVKGNQLGRKLGYPTANIELVAVKEAIKTKSNNSFAYKLIPKQGVYFVKSNIDGKDYYGMMNIGFRPTINGKKQIKEVHFFNLDKNLYSKILKISFLKRIRNEQKFSSLEDLQRQLQRDEEQVRNLILTQKFDI